MRLISCKTFWSPKRFAFFTSLNQTQSAGGPVDGDPAKPKHQLWSLSSFLSLHRHHPKSQIQKIQIPGGAVDGDPAKSKHQLWSSFLFHCHLSQVYTHIIQNPESKRSKSQVAQLTETLRSQNITLDDKEARRLERASTDGKIPRLVFLKIPF